MSERLRKLDALFAEKVLGRTLSAMPFKNIASDEWTDEIVMNPVDGLTLILPRYTRSLDAAWEGYFQIDLPLEMNWYVNGNTADDRTCAVELVTREHGRIIESHGSYSADHPAEALVLACLRAVGCSEEELA